MLYVNGKPAGGGGGSEVIANPQGTPTDDLNTIQIDNDIYQVMGEGGGIDGVFIDTDNIIKSTTTFTNSMSYTATEDCVVAFYIVGKTNTDGLIKIDDKKVGGFYAGSTVGFSCFYNLKDGQTITVTNAHASYTSDYTVYGIQTGTTHSKFQPVIYSLEEREIGVWTDGKPLYEKTITFSNVSKSGKAYFGIANSDTIFVNDGYITEVDTMLPYVHGTAGANNIGGFIRKEQDNSDAYWEFRGGNDAPSTLSGWMNVRYTKTTDTAGSGQWTPQGVPTHHYSTDEQIVGTWVDGSTLYEKTIDLGENPLTVSYNSYTTSSITIQNVNKLIRCEGCSTSNVYASYIAYFDNNVLKIQTPRNGDSMEVKILTLQYTKSS